MLDLPPIKEKWIQQFILLQADPHTPQNAPPPSQKIDWTFPQNKTFYDRVVTWSLNFEGCNLRESCVEMLKIFSLMESVKIWSCSYSFDHPSNDNLFIWCWVFGLFILSQSLGSLFVILCFFFFFVVVVCRNTPSWSYFYVIVGIFFVNWVGCIGYL